MHKPQYVSQRCFRCGCHAGWSLPDTGRHMQMLCHFCVASEHALLLHFGQARRATSQDEYLSHDAAAWYWQRQQECLNVGTNLRLIAQALTSNNELDFQAPIDYTET